LFLLFNRLHRHYSVHCWKHYTASTSLLEPQQYNRLHNLSRTFFLTAKRFSLKSSFLMSTAVLLSFLRGFRICAFKVSDCSKDNPSCQHCNKQLSCRTCNHDHTINIGALALVVTRCSFICAQLFQHLADQSTWQSCGYTTQGQGQGTQHTEQLQAHRYKVGGKGRRQCRQQQLTIRRSLSGGLGMMIGAIGTSAPVKAVAKMSTGVTCS